MRTDTATPIIPNELQTPYPHHPTGRCRDCAYWMTTASDNPNLAKCFLHEEEVNGDWSCDMYWTGELDDLSG